MEPMMQTTALTAYPTSNERLAAVVAHAGTFFAWTLAPLFVYLLTKDDSKYVEFHALQSLLWSLAGTLISLATCGVAIPVFMVFHAIAFFKTLEGEPYEYPFVGEIARGMVT
jgi:uncharacterized Tic20 family protein